MTTPEAPAPPQDDDEGPDAFDLALLAAPAFPPERAHHVGGPQQRVLPAMPTPVVPLSEREPLPDPETRFVPTEEERAATARDQPRPDGGGRPSALSAMGTTLLLVLLVPLVLLLGARVL